MKIKALSGAIDHLPEAGVLIELENKQLVYATGFWIKKDKDNNPIIVIKTKERSFLKG